MHHLQAFVAHAGSLAENRLGSVATRRAKGFGDSNSTFADMWRVRQQSINREKSIRIPRTQHIPVSSRSFAKRGSGNNHKGCWQGFLLGISLSNTSLTGSSEAESHSEFRGGEEFPGPSTSNAEPRPPAKPRGISPACPKRSVVALCCGNHAARC